MPFDVLFNDSGDWQAWGTVVAAVAATAAGIYAKKTYESAERRDAEAVNLEVRMASADVVLTATNLGRAPVYHLLALELEPKRRGERLVQGVRRGGSLAPSPTHGSLTSHTFGFVHKPEGKLKYAIQFRDGAGRWWWRHENGELERHAPVGEPDDRNW
ncbi:hypothetical protein GL325_06775 [Aeromicrobium sp. 636]|uniref:Uncharacterized protein n=1 Tax=Aeromicrobium senzhongii TaxID=2663859 RepID=A0A8I0EVB3_9ACTN|nr:MULTISPECIES: hypothetical protein [Aeromicrobium]MBC9226016.1 hypothetical protein [Aeromicrobium senzhongii]MCQ3998123.1 hypothetical protein [Aeromicrobium sp. 636]